VHLIHDTRDASAVFNFGDALILKVELTSVGYAAQEHELLAFLAKQQLSFKIPTVLFHAVEDDRIFLFEPCMPGKRLNELWWEMDAHKKERVTTRIAEICSQLKAFESHVMTAVDYNWMNPLIEAEERDDTPETRFKRTVQNWAWIAQYSSFLTTILDRLTYSLTEIRL
jgi:hypothetical protein